MEGSNGKRRREGDRGDRNTGRTTANMILVSCCIIQLVCQLAWDVKIILLLVYDCRGGCLNDTIDQDMVGQCLSNGHGYGMVGHLYG